MYVSWHNPHLVLKLELSTLKLTLLLLEDEDPFTVIGDELGRDWGESERNSDSIKDSMEFAAGMESNEEVGEAIFNSPSSLQQQKHYVNIKDSKERFHTKPNSMEPIQSPWSFEFASNCLLFPHGPQLMTVRYVRKVPAAPPTLPPRASVPVEHNES